MQTFKETPLAIVGMACRVPGASNLDEFWQLLVEGRSTIIEAPTERINRRLYYDPESTAPYKSYAAIGGIMTYAPFDPARCPLPLRLLAESEVGHHTMCQVAAEACRHAGLNPFDLPLRNAGVYIGHNLGGPVAGDLIYSTLVESTAQYLLEVDDFVNAAGKQASAWLEQIVRRIRNQLPQRATNGSPECATRMGALIISEALGLTGPSMILDAACSSALQGLAMAARGLQLGRIDMAVVGGASYYHVDSQLIFSRAQSASRRARCCPFDADADGLVSGEGYVAVIVKTLERALADGDPIQCVVRGIGVSSDGRGKSLWAPRKEGQVLAIRRAYEHGLDLARVQYIEAHATSTRIGDMTELKALAEVLRGQVSEGVKIPLGGVKANIGHTLESAGLLGLVKTVLAMQHETIPLQINVEKLNPGIDWETAPLYVPNQNAPWPAFADGHPRRAAVNSFGIGGLNVHVVIDEHPTEESKKSVGVRRPAATIQPQQEPIAIIGAGCIFPGARTLEAYWELLASGRDAKTDVTPDRWNAEVAYRPGSRRLGCSPTKRGGFITDFQCDWRRHKLPPNQIDKADPLQLMILDATDSALADAGYDKAPYDKARTGVVVGTMFGSEFCEQLMMGFRINEFNDSLAQMLREQGIAEDQIAQISAGYANTLLKHLTALLDETGSFTPSTLASRLTKMFDLMGGAVTIDAGQASSLAAIYSAVDMLQDGTCDMVICAAGHRSMTLSTYEFMALRGQLADEQGAAPFDAAARGHLPGEGVGVLVLKRLADAKRDGNRIRGVIRGIGAGFSLNPRDAVSQAISRARPSAEQATSDELLLETSGMGLPEYDNEEMAAVVDSLSGSNRKQPLVVSSVVGQIGHTQGSSGMASLLAAVRSLEKHEVVPRCGMATPAPLLAAHSSEVRLASEKLPLGPLASAEGMLAGVNNLDTSGPAYHLLLERGSEVSASSSAAEASPAVVEHAVSAGAPCWQIVRLGAPSFEALRERVAQTTQTVDHIFALAHSTQFTEKDGERLAIVASSAGDLAEKLKLATELLGTSKQSLLARKDVFVGRKSDVPSAQIAFLFSGQGSQYAGMLKPLVEQFPPAAEALRRVDETLQQLGIAQFSEFAWDKPEGLGKDVWLTQLSLLCADTIIFHSLAALGIHPDCVAGHSFGEFAALVAAGVWDFENAVRGTRARCEAIEACRHVRGSMMSVSAGADLVESLCREVGGSLFAANYNAPEQTVVGGSNDAIDALEALLKSRKIAGKRLPVPRPFHTPLMADTKPLLAAGLNDVAMQAPRVRMVSSITNREVASGDEARANLVAQMTSPVRYVELINQMAQAGAKVLVEVGPHQVLSGLNQQILADRDVVAIASDDKSRGGLSRLLAVQACLEVHGLYGKPECRLEATAARAAPIDDGQATRLAPLDQATQSSDDVLTWSSSTFEMGRMHGESLARSIQAVARRFADVSGMDSEDAAELAPFQGAMAHFTADEREELRGIAEGAGVSAEMLAVYNAWADANRSQAIAQLAVGAEAGRSSPTHGVEEQSAMRRPWGDLNLPSVLRVNRPTSGLAHAVVASPGMIGATAGINECGLAITSAHVEADDALAASDSTVSNSTATLRTLLVRRILTSARSIESALAIIHREARCLSAEFCLSHPEVAEIYYVRTSQGDEQRVSTHSAIATIAQSQCIGAGVGSSGSIIDTSWLEPSNRHEDGFAPELLALSDAFSVQESIEGEQLADLRRLIDTQLSLVMNPAAREIVLRSGGGNRTVLGRYRFTSTVPTTPASPPDEREPPTRPVAPPISEICNLTLAEYIARNRSEGGHTPFEKRGRVCHRFVLRTLETHLPPLDESRQLTGTVLIVGRNAVGMALRKQIEGLGAKAVVLPLSTDVEKTLSSVDKIWQAYEPLTLFVVTSFDDDATTSLASVDWERRRRMGVLVPFLVCQKWFSLLADNKLIEKGCIAAATAMGGNSGLTGDLAAVEGGALTGLIKALSIEFGYTSKGAFRAKVIDVPRHEPPQEVAAAMLWEVRAKSPFTEIGYRGGRRYGNCAVYEPSEAIAGTSPTRGRPWLLTGGARGITAAVARELGRRFGVKLHLLGTTPSAPVDPCVHNLDEQGLKQLRAELTKQAIAEKKPSADVWKSFQKAVEIDKTLRDMDAAGIAVRYHACDASDREALARVIDDIRRTDGPLEGIIHGAGVEVAARFNKKERRYVEQSIGSKVDGAAHLMQLTLHDPLKFFVGFGSISGRWGSIGQTDYALASDMLAKLIGWFRKQRPDCHATCFHWQPWAEIGMAVREETRKSQMLQGLNHLPAAEGVEYLIEELLAGCPDPEPIITDWDYYKRYHPDATDAELEQIFVKGPGAKQTEPKTNAAKPVLPASTSVELASPQVDKAPTVAVRQLMRMVEAPLSGAQKIFNFAGPALILGDNADADALAAHLGRLGVEAKRIPLRDTASETLEELRRLFAEVPAPHLFVMTGREPSSTSLDRREAWLVRRYRGVMLPFELCQNWLKLVTEAGLLDRASLVAVAALGGDFGFSEQTIAPEGGALTGLFKGLYMELVQPTGSPLQIKVIDAPSDEPPEQLAAATIAELAVDGFDVEVAFNRGRRSVVRLLEAPLSDVPRNAIPPGSVWVCTGGARGITAAVARQFGSLYGLKLHLLGTRPKPEVDESLRNADPSRLQELKRSYVRKAIAEGVSPSTYWDEVRRDLEIDRTLHDLESAGVKAVYHSCDVSKWEQLASTLDRIRAADGPIDGIVHGAGIHDAPKTIQESNVALTSELLEVKIDAALNLMLLTSADPIRYFVGFGSISARFGSASASAYTMVNDMLCKLIGWYRGRRPDCHAVGFHWHPWGEVGMMTRPVSQHTIKVFKMKLMPPAEGAAHMIDELCVGAPESEVLITDHQFRDAFFSQELMVAGSRSSKIRSGDLALLEHARECVPGQRIVAEIKLDPLNDPFLSEHRLRDRPTLPLVVALESFAEAVQLVASPALFVACRDVQITNAVRCMTDEPMEVRVKAEVVDGAVYCQLTSDFKNRRGQLVEQDRPHFSAVCETAHQPAGIEAALPPAMGEWFDVQYPERATAPLFHGAPLRLLKRMCADDQHALGDVAFPTHDDLPGERRGQWLIPSAALDACLYACGVYTWLFNKQGFTVPQGLGELRLARAARAGERTTVHVVPREMQDSHGVFDFTLFGEPGDVIFQVRQYRCHVLRGPEA